MGKINNIISAWTRYALSGGDITEEDKRRASICQNCNFVRKGKILTFVKDNLKEVEGMYCGECYCPLSAKIRSNNTEDICHKWEKEQNTAR